MAIIGKSVLINEDASTSEYSEAVSAESIRSIDASESLSLTSAFQVVEGLRKTRGISRSQILVTLRKMGASEKTINLAIKRASHVNSSKGNSI